MPPAHRAATAAERKLLKQYLGLDASADLLLYAREHPVEFAGAWNAVLTGTFTGTKKQKKKAAAAKVVKKVKKAAVPKKPKKAAAKKKAEAALAEMTQAAYDDVTRHRKAHQEFIRRLDELEAKGVSTDVEMLNKEIKAKKPKKPKPPAKKKKAAAKRKKSAEGLEILSTRPLRPSAAAKEKPHYVTKASDPSAEMLAEHAEYMRRYADVIDKRSLRFKSNNGSITREDWERWFVRHPSAKTVSRVAPSRGWPTYREVGGAKLDSPATGKKFRHPKTGKDVTQAKYKEAMAKKPAARKAKKPKAAAKKKKAAASKKAKKPVAPKAEAREYENEDTGEMETLSERLKRIEKKHAEWVKANDTTPEKKAPSGGEHPHRVVEKKRAKAAAAKKAAAEAKTSKPVTSIDDILDRGVPKPDFGDIAVGIADKLEERKNKRKQRSNLFNAVKARMVAEVLKPAEEECQKARLDAAIRLGMDVSTEEHRARALEFVQHQLDPFIRRANEDKQGIEAVTFHKIMEDTRQMLQDKYGPESVKRDFVEKIASNKWKTAVLAFIR